MRLSIRIILIAVLTAVLVTAGCIASVADENTTAFAYSIELADGTVTEYETAGGFIKNIENAPSGSIITLGANMELTKGMRIYGTEDEPKVITIDLAGYGLYSTMKSLVSTMIGARDYATVNVTSSKPDAFIYMIDTATNSDQGGNIFSSIGVDALINVGGCVTLKGEKYPGSNISTFSSCFADVRENTNAGVSNGGSFNCDGGQHYANIDDWLGFITPRSGTGTVTIKNANILVIENASLIHSEANSAKLYLENCLIARLDGTTQYLFNQIHTSIVIKNCITNYSLVSKGEASAGVVTLEGNNVFGAGMGFTPELISGDSAPVAARTNPDLKLVGGDNVWMYDNFGRFNKLEVTLPAFDDAYVFVPVDETFRCTWQYNKDEKTELWLRGEEPVPPVEAIGSAVAGMYKKGWLKVRDEDGDVVYKLTNVNDFGIKVRVDYDGSNICYMIYAPAFIFDDAYISYSEGKIDGTGFSLSDWQKTEIDGESYYAYMTMNIEDEDIDRVVEISIPCDMLDNGKLVKTEGVYRISLSKYLSLVHKNESAYSNEQMEVVRELEEKYFSSVN